MAETYYLPRQFTLTSPFASFIQVRDAETGKLLEKLEAVDQDAGWVEFQHWDEDGHYAPIREVRKVTISLSPTAPAAAKEWFKIPLGADGTRVHAPEPR